MRQLFIITGLVLSVLYPSGGFPFGSSGLDPIPESFSDNVECFLDYMELWVPRRMMDGLLLWLSRVMRFPVSLSSLDRSNRLLSRCRYALDMDNNGNFIFRVHYSACNVQTQGGFHRLEILMVRKTSSGNSRSDRYIMRCPAMAVALGREVVRCDPSYVQVWRPLPLARLDLQDWFLTFQGELVVSVEDASLIGVEVEMNNVSVTARGLRGQLLTPRQFLDRKTDVLPLWMAHGFYAYSLEASCPPVSRHPGEQVVLYIPKQRVGLVKRGSHIAETMTLKNIVVGRSINVTVTEDKQFVMVTIPSDEVLQRQSCRISGNNARGVQLYYSISLILEFTEIAYPMNWTLENYYECSAFEGNGSQESSANMISNKTMGQEDVTLVTAPSSKNHFALPMNPTVSSSYTAEIQDIQYPMTGSLENIASSIAKKHSLVTADSSELEQPGYFVDDVDADISGSGDGSQHPDEVRIRMGPSDLGNRAPSGNSSLRLNGSFSSVKIVEKFMNASRNTTISKVGIHRPLGVKPVDSKIRIRMEPSELGNRASKIYNGSQHLLNSSSLLNGSFSSVKKLEKLTNASKNTQIPNAGIHQPLVVKPVDSQHPDKIRIRLEPSDLGNGASKIYNGSQHLSSSPLLLNDPFSSVEIVEKITNALRNITVPKAGIHRPLVLKPVDSRHPGKIRIRMKPSDLGNGAPKIYNGSQHLSRSSLLLNGPFSSVEVVEKLPNASKNTTIRGAEIHQPLVVKPVASQHPDENGVGMEPFELGNRKPKIYNGGQRLSKIVEKKATASKNTTIPGSGIHQPLGVTPKDSQHPDELRIRMEASELENGKPKIFNGSQHLSKVMEKFAMVTKNTTILEDGIHQPLEVKPVDSSPISKVVQQERFKDGGYGPSTFQPTTLNQEKSQPANQRQLPSKGPVFSPRRINDVDSSEMRPSDALSELLYEAAKDGLLSLGFREDQLRKEEDKVLLHEMPVQITRGLKRESQSSTEHLAFLSSKVSVLSKTHEHSVVWSTSIQHPEEISGRKTSEVEMTVSEENLLLAASQ